MLIHLEKLGKSFGEKIVLHDVTASVEREDRIGIVGQNGAGKTTLLKILTGEYTDYEGEFSVTHGVTLGYLEQNAKLDPTLDIYGEMRSCFAHVLDAMAQMQKSRSGSLRRTGGRCSPSGPLPTTPGPLPAWP